MARIHDLSSLARPLEPDYPTNRRIAALAGATGVLGGLAALLASRGLIGSLWEALLAGGTVFLAWAIARELDPDAEGAALVSGGVAVAWVVAVGLTAAPPPSLLLALTLLMLLRVVVRTVGFEARTLDLLVVLALGAAAGLATLSWTVPALVAAGLLCDRLVAPGASRRQPVFAAAALVAGLAVSMWAGDWAAPLRGGWVPPVAAVATVLFAVRTARFASIRSTADATDEPLVASRVRAGMLLALALATASLIVGLPDAADAGILWAALAGPGAAHLAGSLAALARS